MIGLVVASRQRRLRLRIQLIVRISSALSPRVQLHDGLKVISVEVIIVEKRNALFNALLLRLLFQRGDQCATDVRQIVQIELLLVRRCCLQANVLFDFVQQAFVFIRARTLSEERREVHHAAKVTANVGTRRDCGKDRLWAHSAMFDPVLRTCAYLVGQQRPALVPAEDHLRADIAERDVICSVSEQS